MKKVLFIAIVAVASLASCKKDKTCTCTTTKTSTQPGYVSPAPTTSVTTWEKVKKSDAAISCASGTDSYETTYADTTPPYSHTATVTSTSTCTLK